VEAIPDAELWRVHSQRRAHTVAFVRQRMHEQLTRRGASSERLHQASEVLNSEALTIVFARRFATYKRASFCCSAIRTAWPGMLERSQTARCRSSSRARPTPRIMRARSTSARWSRISEDPRFAQKVVFHGKL
jgi:starch phosphorylase